MDQSIINYEDEHLINSYRKMIIELDTGIRIIKHYGLSKIKCEQKVLTNKEIKKLKIKLKIYTDEIIKRGIGRDSDSTEYTFNQVWISPPKAIINLKWSKKSIIKNKIYNTETAEIVA